MEDSLLFLIVLYHLPFAMTVASKTLTGVYEISKDFQKVSFLISLKRKHIPFKFPNEGKETMYAKVSFTNTIIDITQH